MTDPAIREMHALLKTLAFGLVAQGIMSEDPRNNFARWLFALERLDQDHEALLSGAKVQLPQSTEQAEAMLKVALHHLPNKSREIETDKHHAELWRGLFWCKSVKFDCWADEDGHDVSFCEVETRKGKFSATGWSSEEATRKALDAEEAAPERKEAG